MTGYEKTKDSYVRVHILTVVSMKMRAIWDIAVYGAISQMALIFKRFITEWQQSFPKCNLLQIFNF
jgi:hypothetical protein